MRKVLPMKKKGGGGEGGGGKEYNFTIKTLLFVFVRIVMKSIFHLHFIKGTNVPPTSGGNA